MPKVSLHLKVARATIIIFSAVAGVFSFYAQAYAQVAISSVGTFHNIGITADLSAEEYPNVSAVPRYRPRGSQQAFKAGMPLSRVSPSRLSGSLFWLSPGTTYEVQLQFIDANGGVVNQLTRTFSASTRQDIKPVSPLRRLHVNATGGNTDCALNRPCSLSVAIGAAQPGDEVVLTTGRYFTGELRTQRSGTADKPIVIRAEENGRAILDGAYPQQFKWTRVSQGLYRTDIDKPGAHLVVVDGRRLMSYRSLEDLKALHWGLPGIYAEQNSLYIKLKKGADPNGRYIAVSRFNDAFRVDHDYFRFEGLEFNHYGHGEYAIAIYFMGGSNNVVQRNRFVNNDVDIAFKYATGGNVIQDNVFFDTVQDWPWDAVKTSRGDPTIEAGAVMMYGPMTGQGNVIRRNTFQGQFDAVRPCAPDANKVGGETDVYRNTISRIADDAIEADGDCLNIRIFQNHIHDVLVGISTAPARFGPTYIVRNLIYRTGFGNNQFAGTSFKFNNNYAGFTGPIYLFHNTIDAVLKNSHGIDLKNPSYWTGIVSRNNIYRGTEFAISNVNTEHPVDFQYDNFVSTSRRNYARWGEKAYRSLGALKSATSTFAHTLNVKPGFRNTDYGDYTLNASSALIDAGVPIPGINDDYSGSAPDVGAFEFR